MIGAMSVVKVGRGCATTGPADHTPSATQISARRPLESADMLR
jgi:hypothetical protein